MVLCWITSEPHKILINIIPTVKNCVLKSPTDFEPGPPTEGLSRNVPVRSKIHIVSGLGANMRSLGLFLDLGIVNRVVGSPRNPRSKPSIHLSCLEPIAPRAFFSTPPSSQASPIAPAAFEIRPVVDAPWPTSSEVAWDLLSGKCSCKIWCHFRDGILQSFYHYEIAPTGYHTLEWPASFVMQFHTNRGVNSLAVTVGSPTQIATHCNHSLTRVGNDFQGLKGHAALWTTGYCQFKAIWEWFEMTQSSSCTI